MDSLPPVIILLVAALIVPLLPSILRQPDGSTGYSSALYLPLCR